MEIKKRHAVILLLCFVVLVRVVHSFQAMAAPTTLRIILYSLLTASWVNVWTNAQVALPCSNSTAINGTPFPSLIDATAEDLISGLESGLFTSVDLVNTYIARIMEVSRNMRPTNFAMPNYLTAVNALIAFTGPL
jgi:amidase